MHPALQVRRAARVETGCMKVPQASFMQSRAGPQQILPMHIALSMAESQNGCDLDVPHACEDWHGGVCLQPSSTKA